MSRFPFAKEVWDSYLRRYDDKLKDSKSSCCEIDSVIIICIE